MYEFSSVPLYRECEITSIATMDVCVHRHNGRNSMEPPGDMKILDGIRWNEVEVVDG